MKKKDLVMRIPKRFKERLRQRFMAKNIKWDSEWEYWDSSIPCPLCAEYRSCRDCIFNSIDGDRGCIGWLKDIGVKTWRMVECIDKRGTVEHMREVRKLAPKYIEWIDDLDDLDDEKEEKT